MTAAPLAFEISEFLKFCLSKEGIRIRNSTLICNQVKNSCRLLVAVVKNFKQQKFYQTNRLLRNFGRTLAISFGVEWTFSLYNQAQQWHN